MQRTTIEVTGLITLVFLITAVSSWALWQSLN